MLTPYKTEIKWAVIFSLVSLCWLLLEKIAGLHGERIDQHIFYTNFFAIPATLVYVFALLDKRNRDFDGYMTYKQGFISGMVITLGATILAPLTQYIGTTWITPDYFSTMIEYTVMDGQLRQEEAENYFNTRNYMIQAAVGVPIMGTITSAIVAFFVKKVQRNAADTTAG